MECITIQINNVSLKCYFPQVDRTLIDVVRYTSFFDLITSEIRSRNTLDSWYNSIRNSYLITLLSTLSTHQVSGYVNQIEYVHIGGQDVLLYYY